ncbi:chitinase [Planosporangium flavigriseum]|uniref:chitinase n=1 Tax=Planosporangium flavigriseum TaxID=373681 RepID=A0A8J3LV29_9ACTN|nr:glycosyl hydrolase family 18 protein [Planosporangium flavigriseum]NJC66877.1 chitinase [Planosporangium flavigriseum]GIG74379.1 chitinase [Planosporangium flavigriseum]
MNRKRASFIAAGTAALLATGAIAVVASAANAAGSVTASFTTNSWETGQTATYTITNGTSNAITSWTVEFDLPAGTALGAYWDALMTQSGTHVVAKNREYNGAVAAGGTTSFGFNTTGAGAPTNCTVNGAPCAGGTQPPPPTTAPPTTTPPTTTPPTTNPPPPPPGGGGNQIVGYFAEWGVYGRNYHVKNIHTSGSAAKLTHLLYAFGNTTGGRCAIGDSYADYDKAYSAADSVDGVADTWDAGALRGSFNQLRKLKKMYPHLKVIWSFGGWTWSGGFTQAAANPAAFAESCYSLVEDPRWADVFDGIDVDWEYPNACGLQCDTSGPNAFTNVVSALRSRFGPSALVTAAITADGSNGGKIDATDYAGAAPHLNWLMPMTYDYFGAFNAQGPTAPHSPLTSYPGIPQQGFNSDAAIQKLKSKGIPANKLLLGIGFYGRGWTGVTQEAPGGTATGAAPGTYEAGIEDYKVLKNTCPANRTIAGTAYAKCGSNWWSYDTPATIGGKMTYAKSQGLGGAFFWELSGDTPDGELIGAMRNGLG